MRISDKRRLSAGMLLAGWLALGGCTHANKNPPPEKKLRDANGPWTPTEARLYFDIDRAQDIEQHRFAGLRPEDSVRFVYGTDSLHRTFHFANLRALRLDIKRRMDSLRVAGVVLSYDTVDGPEISHGTLRTIPNDSAAVSPPADTNTH